MLSTDQSAARLPATERGGWELVNGSLEVKWTDSQNMPQELIEILVEEPEPVQRSQEQEEPESEPEMDNADE